MPDIGIIMGSDSDLQVMKEAGEMLIDLVLAMNIPFVLPIVCPRLPLNMLKTRGQRNESNHRRVGGAAHLPGVIAAYTLLPVGCQ